MKDDATGSRRAWDGAGESRCLNCAHFRVSWDPAFPRSCLVFGIKCRSLPSQEVFLATGKPCPAFAPRG